MTLPNLDLISLPSALVGSACDFVFDRESVRALDRSAIDDFGMPSSILMENAATALAHVADQLLCPERPRAVIVCGPGNNGGDGFALARKLLNLGRDARVVTLCDASRFKGDAAMNMGVLQHMRAPIECMAGDSVAGLEAQVDGFERALIVDALFGTGLTDSVRSPYDTVIQWINAHRQEHPSSCVLAVDIPSGLDCDTGLPLGDQPERTVRADVTVTLAGLKTGLQAASSNEFAGRVMAADIGAPIALLERFGDRIGSAS